MNESHERAKRGELPEMILAFLEERGPMSISSLATGMGRVSSNLYGALHELRDKGKIVQDEATRTWSLVSQTETPGAPNGASEPHPPEVNAPLTQLDPIEGAIRALRDQQRTKKKIETARSYLKKALEALED